MKKPPAKKSATARKPADTAPKTRKTAVKTDPSSVDEPVGTAEPPRASKNILTAGIKALANAHGEAVAHQSRVFESLLGLGQNRDANAPIGEKVSGPSKAALDPFGFKKFEDVFDQRVARTLQRLGVPSAQAVADLTAEVERLRDELDRIKTQGKKR
jgi:hypothetical protein